MKQFFKIVSLVFQPFLIPTFAMIMMVNMDIFAILPLRWRLVSVFGTLFFTGLMPLFLIWFQVLRGKVSNFFISNRNERSTPYIFTMIAYAFWAYFMYQKLYLPMFIAAAGAGSAFAILAVLVINYWWKISAHLAAMGGFTAAVFGVCFRCAMNPTWIFILILAISALVALARLELKEHTPGQVLAGYSLGFVAVFIPCLFF